MKSNWNYTGHLVISKINDITGNETVSTYIKNKLSEVKIYSVDGYLFFHKIYII